MPPAKGAKKAAPKAHKLAVQFPKGLVLRDLYKKEWQLGDVVGTGGFGLIYQAFPVEKKDKTETVIKIEPKGNGPLFCEMTFYQRLGKKHLMEAFIQKRKLKYLPVPPFISTGLHDYMSKEYRFLTMPRYGTDLQKLLVESDGTFPAKVVFSVGLRILDALQYLHENEYVHADVKAANILQGYSQGKVVTNEVYLVDYGLAYRYTVEGNHKEYKEDPRKAHDGTIEFTSRDAHKGVFPSRRADLEILSYCLMQWMCGKLPWENKLSDPVYVASCKEKFFQSVTKSVSSCFSGSANPNSVHSDTMVKVLELIKKLEYTETPNYDKLRSFLKDGLKKEGQKDEWTICFAAKAKVSTEILQNDASDSLLKTGQVVECYHSWVENISEKEILQNDALDSFFDIGQIVECMHSLIGNISERSRHLIESTLNLDLLNEDSRNNFIMSLIGSEELDALSLIKHLSSKSLELLCLLGQGHDLGISFDQEKISMEMSMAEERGFDKNSITFLDAGEGSFELKPMGDGKFDSPLSSNVENLISCFEDRLHEELETEKSKAMIRQEIDTLNSESDAKISYYSHSEFWDNFTESIQKPYQESIINDSTYSRKHFSAKNSPMFTNNSSTTSLHSRMLDANAIHYSTEDLDIGPCYDSWNLLDEEGPSFKHLELTYFPEPNDKKEITNEMVDEVKLIHKHENSIRKPATYKSLVFGSSLEFYLGQFFGITSDSLKIKDYNSSGVLSQLAGIRTTGSPTSNSGRIRDLSRMSLRPQYWSVLPSRPGKPETLSLNHILGKRIERKQKLFKLPDEHREEISKFSSCSYLCKPAHSSPFPNAWKINQRKIDISQNPRFPGAQNIGNLTRPELSDEYYAALQTRPPSEEDLSYSPYLSRQNSHNRVCQPQLYLQPPEYRIPPCPTHWSAGYRMNL